MLVRGSKKHEAFLRNADHRLCIRLPMICSSGAMGIFRSVYFRFLSGESQNEKAIEWISPSARPKAHPFSSVTPVAIRVTLACCKAGPIPFPNAWHENHPPLHRSETSVAKKGWRCFRSVGTIHDCNVDYGFKKHDAFRWNADLRSSTGLPMICSSGAMRIFRSVYFRFLSTRYRTKIQLNVFSSPPGRRPIRFHPLHP